MVIAHMSPNRVSSPGARARFNAGAAAVLIAIFTVFTVTPATAGIDVGSIPRASRSAPGTGHPHTKGPTKGTPFALCPVDRPHHYLDDFGDARYAGGFHRHEGIDIFAPRGTPVRAPFAGVAKVSRSWAGGLAVYVYGKRGFVYNAHLTALGHLGKVWAGTVVGYVGNSGDAIGASTHDHFEWHPHGGPAVDGFALLNAVCRGTPTPPPRPTYDAERAL